MLPHKETTHSEELRRHVGAEKTECESEQRSWFRQKLFLLRLKNESFFLDSSIKSLLLNYRDLWKAKETELEFPSRAFLQPL